MRARPILLLSLLLTLPYLAAAQADTDPPVAHAGTPGWNELITGSTWVRGWAVDASGVTSVQFLVDGSTSFAIVNPSYGRYVPGACDLHSYLNDPNCPYVGWEAELDTTRLTNGSHTLTVKAWDAAGNLWQFTRPIQVDNPVPDTDPPVAHAGTPGWNELLRGTDLIQGWATDASGVSLVKFLVDGSSTGIVNPWYGRSVSQACSLHSYLGDPNCPYVGWEATLDTTRLSDGSHTFTVEAWDAAGNLWRYDRPIRVDNRAPSVTITNPPAGDVVRDNQTIFVSASDWGSLGSGVDRVQFRVNGSLLFTDTSAPYSYLWDTKGQGNEGTNTLRVKAFDVAGNVTSVSHSVTVDNTPPTSTLTAPSNGALLRGTRTLKATASDNVGISSVRFWVDGQHLSGDATAPYTASWDTRTVADGTHSIYARAHDQTSLPGQSQTVQVTVDNTAPGATLTAPADGETVGGDVVLTVSASDTHGIGDVRFFVDGARVTIDSTAPYAYTWDTSSAGNGPHNIVARAFDQAGNSTWSATHTVTVFNPDFTLSFVQETGLELDTRGVEPGGTTDLAVRFTRTDGSSDPASLSVTGLPAGVSVSHPSQIWPGQTATVQLTADLGAADATHPFEVVASAGGGTSAVAGALIVADLPNITFVSPQTIPAGTVSTVTLTGTDFEGADVWFATEKPDPGSPDRIFPVATVLSVAPGGTSVQAEIDATAPGVEGYYNLVVTNSAGGAATPIRVLPDRPVVEIYTPSEPSESDVYVFVASGVNLADATLSASDPSITFLEVEASDTEILGFMHVATGASPTAEVYVSSSKGSVTLPIEVMSAPVESRTGNVITGQSTTDPGLLIQQFAPLGASLEEEPWWAGISHSDSLFEIPCGGIERPLLETWSYTYQISDLLGRKGQEVLDQLKILAAHTPYTLDLTILELYTKVEVRIFFRCEISFEHGLRFTDVNVCLSGLARIEVIERHSVTCAFDACLSGGFAGGCETTGAFASLGNFWTESSTSCTQAKDITYNPEGEPDPDPHGDRLVEVLAEGCCPDTVSFHGSGTSSGGHLFDEKILEAETDVEPGSCGGPGVATDTDYTVIAWLNEGPPRDAVTQLAPLANDGLRIILPADGPGDLFDFNTVGCVSLFNNLQVGLTQLVPVNTDADRRYVNAWVLAFGGDPPPPSSFQSLDPTLGDLASFVQTRQYRVMAHLATTHDGTQVEIQGSPLAETGQTKDPCTGLRLPFLGNTEPHDDHGAQGVRSENAFVLTEARVGTIGQRVDRTLNCPTCDVGETTPWIWAVIRVDPAGELNPGQGIAFGGIDHQMFPTYAVYKDGVKIFSSQQSDHEQFIALDATSERREEEIP